MDPGCWTGRVHLHIFSSTNTSLRDTGQFPPCRTASEACFTCTMNLETYTLTVSTTKIRLECLVSRWDLYREGDRPCTCWRMHCQTLQHRLGSFHGIHDLHFFKKKYIIYPDDSNLQSISCTTLQCDSSKMYNNRTQKQNMVWLTDLFIFLFLMFHA